MNSGLQHKITAWITERRMPSAYTHNKNKAIAGIKARIYYLEWLWGYCASVLSAGGRPKGDIKDLRYLYASAVNKDGKPYLEKVIRAMDLPNVDYLVFCYDDTRFDEEVFRDVRVITEPGFKLGLAKKYMTPEYCKDYDYIILWDDDFDLGEFSFTRFITIMHRNLVEYAQPAISSDSNVNVEITRAQPGRIGRFTDYVENGAPVFTRQAWEKFWTLMDAETTFWGGQYCKIARFACGYRRIAIIDQEHIAHTRPHQSFNKGSIKEKTDFFERNTGFRKCKRVNFAELR